MRKSFYQMLQLVEGNIINQHYIKKYPEDYDVRRIFNSIKDENQKQLIAVKLALYCIEDCSQLIPENHELKSLAQQCINKIKSWLIDPYKQGIQEELDLLGNNAWNAVYNARSLNYIYYTFIAISFACNVTSSILNDYLINNVVTNSSMAFYEINNQNENIEKQKLSQYKNYLITLMSNIEFDTKTDKELFINQITNNNTKSPQFWNTDEWLYFFTLAQDEYAIPLITQHNNSWIINPNLGNYNIETKDSMQLINYIITNPDLKNFRLQLYDKILNLNTV